MALRFSRFEAVLGCIAGSRRSSRRIAGSLSTVADSASTVAGFD